jgi:hypothetical protein
MTSGEPYVYSEVYPLSRGHYVYRCWDAAGRCLYIGRAGECRPCRVSSRLGEHKRKAWWPDVTRVDVAVLASPQAIWAEEQFQIEQHDPIHNQRLRGRCPIGHDLSLPRARTTNGQCRLCHNAAVRRISARPGPQAQRAKYRRRPEVMERSRRQWRRRRYGPSPGQQPLWRSEP